jgi:hypothetical protein
MPKPTRTRRTNHPTQGGEIAEPEGQKVVRENRAHKDVKNEATSGDVHENTGPDDNLTDTEGDISA